MIIWYLFTDPGPRWEHSRTKHHRGMGMVYGGAMGYAVHLVSAKSPLGEVSCPPQKKQGDEDGTPVQVGKVAAMWQACVSTRWLVKVAVRCQD